MSKRTAWPIAAAVATLLLCNSAWAGMFGTGVGEIPLPHPSAPQTLKLSNPKARATIDVSDIWWNPNESGWGMQLVQNDDFVFATLFVYGPDGKPTWLTAEMNNVGGLTWTGPLYATTGPWFGAAPFDPTQVGVRQAGSMTFHLTDIADGNLTYTVDGVTVSKEVTRETLVDEDISGSYNFAITQTQTCIPSLPSGTFSTSSSLNISQSGASVVGQTSSASGACTFLGTYAQFGKLGSVDGTYSCTSGEAGTFQIYEIVVTETGLLARFSEQSNYCSSISGQEAGIRQ
ncbi:MAG: hypothetical protein WA900_01875 [Casimicrobiaceae bacterium]